MSESTSREEPGYILGYDLGTSALKVALFQLDGTVVADSRADYPLSIPQEGWAEQDPTLWWQAIRDATRELLFTIDPSMVKAVGVSAQMEGTLPVDHSGNPLHPALIWLDTRSEFVCRSITAGWPKVSGYGLWPLLQWLYLTNGAPSLMGKDLVSKMLWFREALPAVYERTTHFLDVKDYLLFRLCGQYVTSDDCAHLSWLMDNRSGRRQWSDYLLNKLAIDPVRLPQIRRSTDLCDHLSTDAARELGLDAGTPVIVGSGDVNATALGAGNIDDGAIHLYVGTSSWLGAHHNKRAVDVATGVATICAADPGRYLLIAAQELAGGCVDWAMDNIFDLSRDDGGYLSFTEMASRADAGAGGVHFFPWLAGERVPVDQTRLRGGFANLSLTHGREELARAILEGIALNSRWAISAVARLAKNASGEVRFVGGGARSALWSQIYADVLQRPVTTLERPELAAARGAAMMAAVGIGHFSSLKQACSMCRTDRCYRPDKETKHIYDEKFKQFKQAYRANRSWYERVNG